MSFADNDALPSLIEEIPGESTASYVSVLDWKTNELICGFGDMGIYERQMTPAFLEKYLDLFMRNQWIMFDANLSPIAMQYLIEIGRKHRKQLVFISAGGPTKARRIQPYLNEINVLFCNRLEFEAITESSSIVSTANNWMKSKSNLKLICITMGAEGVLIGAKGSLKKYKALTMNDQEQQEIRNVTGAGDSFAAGVVSQLLTSHFENIDRAVACGLLAAKLTLTSANTISEQLKTIDERMIDEICSSQLRSESLDSSSAAL